MTATATQREVGQVDEWTKPPFLRRVRIKGYKSIAFCDVQLQPLTLLVGRNGAGKSNLFDALAFLGDVMGTSIPEAVRRHGGWRSILCRWSENGEIEFLVGFTLPSRPTADAEYGFALKEGPNESPVLIREWYRERGTTTANAPHFSVTGTSLLPKPRLLTGWQFYHPEIPCEQLPPPRPDRPWLDSFGKEPFIEVAEGLRRMGYYNFHPDSMRQPQKPSHGSMLERTGSNLASAIHDMKDLENASLERIRDYLALVNDDVKGFEVATYGDYETVRFDLKASPPSPPLRFDASSMSDGTLRALAALVAAFQIQLPTRPSVIGIEEPETSLHPAAMRALVDAMDEATAHTQVLLTTHSADLLSGRDITPGQVLIVRGREGRTQITPVDPASREIIEKELYSLADLQRMDRLDLDEADVSRQAHTSNGV